MSNILEEAMARDVRQMEAMSREKIRLAMAAIEDGIYLALVRDNITPISHCCDPKKPIEEQRRAWAKERAANIAGWLMPIFTPELL